MPQGGVLPEVGGTSQNEKPIDQLASGNLDHCCIEEVGLTALSLATAHGLGDLGNLAMGAPTPFQDARLWDWVSASVISQG